MDKTKKFSIKLFFMIIGYIIINTNILSASVPSENFNNNIQIINEEVKNPIIKYLMKNDFKIDSLSKKDSLRPLSVPLKTTTQFGVGDAFICALDNLGKLYCWGKNDSGQLGINSTTDTNTPTLIYDNGSLEGTIDGEEVIYVGIGRNHACAINANNLLYCWGGNEHAKLGDGTSTKKMIPTPVNGDGKIGNKGVIQVALNHSHSCAIDEDNKLYCWGYGGNGRLGLNSTTSKDYPTLIYDNGSLTGTLGGYDVLTVECGLTHTCALSYDYKLYCWGDNANGRVGINSTTQKTIPTLIYDNGSLTGTLDGKNVIKVSAGYEHTCAINTDNKLYCWGNNGYGQIGDGTTTQKKIPTIVNTNGTLGNQGVIEVSAGLYSTCAINNSNKIYCWGDNSDGEIGDGTTSGTDTPTYVYNNGTLGNENASKVLISKNTNLSCATNSNNILYCWGNPSYVTASSSDNITKPILIYDVAHKQRTGTILTQNITSSSAGENHTCTISNNKLFCWGHNDYGQLGNNTTTDSEVPTPIYDNGSLKGTLDNENVIQVSSGTNHSCAINSENKLYCWGSNNSGKLGDGTTSDSLTPILVNGDGTLDSKNVIKVSVGSEHTCAINSENKLFCWGYNGNGRLGINSTTEQRTPTLIYDSGSLVGTLGGQNVISVSTGKDHTCAINNLNKLYCWGNNGSGRLGINSTTAKNIPTLIYDGGSLVGTLGGENVISVSAGTEHTCAINNLNKLYCWGKNTNGRLGINSTSQKNVPTLVYDNGSLTGTLGGENVIKVSTGDKFTCAINNINKLYCWGYNTNGNVGNNDTTDVTIPTLIYDNGSLTGTLGSENAISISAGYNHTCAINNENKLYCWGYNNYGQCTKGESFNTLNFDKPNIFNYSSCPFNSNNYEIGGTCNNGSGICNRTGTWSCSYPELQELECIGDLNYPNPNGEICSNNLDDNCDGTTDELACYEYDCTDNINYSLIDTTCDEGVGACNASGLYYCDRTDDEVKCDATPGSEGDELCNDIDDDCDGSTDENYDVGTSCTVGIGACANTGVKVCTNDTLSTVCNVLPKSSRTEICGDNIDNDCDASTDEIADCKCLDNGDITEVSLGNSHTCAINSANKLYCWGYNNFGQLGDNTTTNKSTPILIYNENAELEGLLDGLGVINVALGSNHTCAINSANKLYCWGYNNSGQLGDNTTTDKYTPTLIYNENAELKGLLGGLGVRVVKTGGYHTCAINTANKLYCWGLNNSGQLGVNTTTSKNIPTLIYNENAELKGLLGGLGVIDIALGSDHTCAINTDNKLYCWGNNLYGQLGDNTNSYKTSPTLIHDENVELKGLLGGLGVISVSTGTAHTCAINSANKLYCWGKNSNGQLGDNTTTDTTTPKLIYNESVELKGLLDGLGVRKVNTGGYHTCAINSANKLYCWGLNSGGRLGDNTIINRTIPTLIYNENSLLKGFLDSLGVIDITLGSDHTCAINTDNNLYCWGTNGFGLGNGTNLSRKPIFIEVTQNILGTECSAGLGICSTEGEYTCNKTTGVIACNAVAGNAGTETCANMGTDDDCDGITDNIPNLGDGCTGESVGNGICANTQGTYTCSGNSLICQVSPLAAGTESCNGLDDDCDGLTDEDDVCGASPTVTPSYECSDGDTQSCDWGYTGSSDSFCKNNGTQTCVGGFWSSCVAPSLSPSTETCANMGTDDDCDGTTDNIPHLGDGCTGESVGVGICANTQGTYVCSGNDLICQVNPLPAGSENCSNIGIDNDCDGITDEIDILNHRLDDTCLGTGKWTCIGNIATCDLCPDDPNKTNPESCGCGVPETDTDDDGVPDCIDECPNNPDKSEEGQCGCNEAEIDTDEDGTPDCEDECIYDPYKTEDGICGCGKLDDYGLMDSDGDGTIDCLDACPYNPFKAISAGVEGCDAVSFINPVSSQAKTAQLYVPKETFESQQPNAPEGLKTNSAVVDTLFLTESECENSETSLDFFGNPHCVLVSSRTAIASVNTSMSNNSAPSGFNSPKGPILNAPALSSSTVVSNGVIYEVKTFYGSDADNDGIPNCIDDCPEDTLPEDDPDLLMPSLRPGKFKLCFTEEPDLCPDDPHKNSLGICGCGIPDPENPNPELVDLIGKYCIFDYQTEQTETIDGPNHVTGSCYKVIGQYVCDGNGGIICSTTEPNCEPEPECITGATESCSWGYQGTNNACQSGTKTCSVEGTWGECVPPTGIAEICGDNIDNDCDNSIDEDDCTCLDPNNDLNKDCSDGYGVCRVTGNFVCDKASGNVICNATADTSKQSSTEICGDGVDNNCNDQIDEDNCTCPDPESKLNTDCSDGYGACRVTGSFVCDKASGNVVCNATADTSKQSPTEICADNIDNDCDNEIDESDCTCPDPDNLLNLECSAGKGACSRTGTYVCNKVTGAIECNAVAGTGTDEMCNGIDDDCDGLTDEDFTKKGQSCTEGDGVCQGTGTYVCNNEGNDVVCNAVADESKKGEEICGDGIDQDCNGVDLSCVGCQKSTDYSLIGTSCTINSDTSCESSNGVYYCPDNNPESEVLCNSTPPACCEDKDFSKINTQCNVGKGACQNNGTYVCSGTNPNSIVICSVSPHKKEKETCNNIGIDNNCNGISDEIDSSGHRLNEACLGIGKWVCIGDVATCDLCPNNPNKTEPGKCGCGVPDIDSDGDKVLDCNDECPNDKTKDKPGVCGCGVPDIDSDKNGVFDCKEKIRPKTAIVLPTKYTARNAVKIILTSKRDKSYWLKVNNIFTLNVDNHELNSKYQVEISNLKTNKRIKFKTIKQKNIIRNLNKGTYKAKYKILITKENGERVTGSKWSKYSFFIIK